MAYTTIKKPSSYFNTKLYTGNGTDATGITGVGFQPDWVWIKERSSTSPHKLLDAVRGATKELESNTTNAEATTPTSLQSFDSDGFTVGTNGAVNENTQTYASWNWLANGTGVANTDGNVNTTISVNTTSGFSIISANTGSTTGELTLGHGLNAIPSMFIWKNRDDAGQNWQVYHKSTGTGLMRLNDSGVVNTAVTFWNTPTTTLFKMTDNMYSQNKNFIGYCFADVQGFSKFGSYVGNGSGTDGTFVYTGFKPAWLLIKETTQIRNWVLYDNKRVGYNPNQYEFLPDTSNTEDTTTTKVDLLSNGFKIKASHTTVNENAQTYIYMAFASEPLVGDNPTTAR